MTPSQRMRANRDTVHAYDAERICASIRAHSDAIRSHLDAHAHSNDIHNREQAQELIDHGRCQEANEKSFCLGMMVGGAVALTVLVLTLKLLGVI